MKNSFLTSIFLFFAIQLSYSQSKTNIHEVGIYKYQDPRAEGFFIKRTKTKQIEFNKSKGQKMVLKVKWTSDTHYILTFVKDNYNSPEDACLKKGDTIEVDITDSKPKYYTCSFTTKNCGGSSTTFIKVK